MYFPLVLLNNHKELDLFRQGVKRVPIGQKVPDFDEFDFHEAIIVSLLILRIGPDKKRLPFTENRETRNESWSPEIKKSRLGGGTKNTFG